MKYLEIIHELFLGEVNHEPFKIRTLTCLFLKAEHELHFESECQVSAGTQLIIFHIWYWNWGLGEKKEFSHVEDKEEHFAKFVEDGGSNEKMFWILVEEGVLLSGKQWVCFIETKQDLKTLHEVRAASKDDSYYFFSHFLKIMWWLWVIENELSV